MTSPHVVLLCLAAFPALCVEGLQKNKDTVKEADAGMLQLRLAQAVSKLQAAKEIREKAQAKAAEGDRKIMEVETMVQSTSATAKWASKKAKEAVNASVAAKFELSEAEKVNDDAEKLNIKAGLERAKVHHLKKKLAQAGQNAKHLSKKRTKKIGTLKKQMREVQRQLTIAETELKESLKSDVNQTEKDGLLLALEASVAKASREAAEASANVEKFNKTKQEAHANMTTIKREAAWVMYEIDAAEKHVQVLEDNATATAKMSDDEADKIKGLQDYVASYNTKQKQLQEEITQAKTQAKRAKQYITVHGPVSKDEDDEAEDQ